MIATIVDTQALLDTVVASAVAGIATTIVFSLTILGAVRFSDANREGRTLEATFFGILAALGTLATVGAAVVAVIVMTSK
jgi:hypothetical protein